MKFHRHFTGKRRFDESKALQRIDDKRIKQRTPRKDREFEAPKGSEVNRGEFGGDKELREKLITMAMQNVTIDMSHFDPDATREILVDPEVEKGIEKEKEVEIKKGKKKKSK